MLSYLLWTINKQYGYDIASDIAFLHAYIPDVSVQESFPACIGASLYVCFCIVAAVTLFLLSKTFSLFPHFISCYKISYE